MKPNISAHIAPPEGITLHCWYCPGLGAYRWPDEVLPPCWAHLLTQMEWVPLYARDIGADLVAGWTLRSYYCPAESAFYASHRTMSEKTAKQLLVELFAPPGAYGNDSAGHVPPKKLT